MAFEARGISCSTTRLNFYAGNYACGYTTEQRSA